MHASGKKSEKSRKITNEHKAADTLECTKTSSGMNYVRTQCVYKNNCFHVREKSYGGFPSKSTRGAISQYEICTAEKFIATTRAISIHLPLCNEILHVIHVH